MAKLWGARRLSSGVPPTSPGICAPNDWSSRMVQSCAGAWRSKRGGPSRSKLRRAGQPRERQARSRAFRRARDRRRINKMSFLNKLGLGVGAGAGRGISHSVASSGRPRPSGTTPAAAVGATRAPELRESTRVSNGLKEFLWNLDGLGRGTLLDLGPAWQTTLSFFIERGFRVSSEDILREWKEFLVEEETRLRAAAGNPSQELDVTPAGRAARFLEN